MINVHLKTMLLHRETDLVMEEYLTVQILEVFTLNMMTLILVSLTVYAKYDVFMPSSCYLSLFKHSHLVIFLECVKREYEQSTAQTLFLISNTPLQF